MILHPDNISIQGGLYRPCESTFVDVDVCLMPGGNDLVCASFVVTDALGHVHGSALSGTFLFTNLALVTAEAIGINLDVAPSVLPKGEPCLTGWDMRPLSDRAVIRLHATYDHKKVPGKKKMTFLHFIFRLLVHIPALQLVFVMEEDRVVKIRALFGDQAPGKHGFVVEGIPKAENEIRERGFVPISETSET